MAAGVIFGLAGLAAWSWFVRAEIRAMKYFERTACGVRNHGAPRGVGDNAAGYLDGSLGSHGGFDTVAGDCVAGGFGGDCGGGGGSE
ncbi:MAG: hypothetical protein EPN97_18930 [Alphaproteobacteria bacterium]|nr:MAG: hypothetical protein EPN97_18930 [Alphaproteobacteria bacterium]